MRASPRACALPCHEDRPPPHPGSLLNLSFQGRLCERRCKPGNVRRLCEKVQTGNVRTWSRKSSLISERSLTGRPNFSRLPSHPRAPVTSPHDSQPLLRARTNSSTCGMESGGWQAPAQPGPAAGPLPPCLLLACPSASCISCVLSCLCHSNSCLSIVFFLVRRILSNCLKLWINREKCKRKLRNSSSQCRLAVRYKLARHSRAPGASAAQRGCKSAHVPVPATGSPASVCEGAP